MILLQNALEKSSCRVHTYVKEFEEVNKLHQNPRSGSSVEQNLIPILHSIAAENGPKSVTFTLTSGFPVRFPFSIMTTMKKCPVSLDLDLVVNPF